MNGPRRTFNHTLVGRCPKWNVDLNLTVPATLLFTDLELPVLHARHRHGGSELTTQAQNKNRHRSLVPLSREHHYALMLCLRINRGLPIHSHDASWLDSKSQQVISFFAGDLLSHFKAEEEIVFPAMSDVTASAGLISELLSEHRAIQRLVSELRSAKQESIPTRLKEFAAILEAHIRKEERLLFPIYEREVSSGVANRVEQDVLALIGNALQPRNPDLIE
jgi:hemerythrin-like domain-containing protein